MGMSGSEGGPEKPTSCKAGWAPRSDPYTEHCTSEGTVHCCAMLDVYSRMIVGWSIADHIRTSLVVDALQMACWRRRPPPGTICHGNQGNTRPGVRAPAAPSQTARLDGSGGLGG